MVTHRNEWQVLTSIYVTPRNQRGDGQTPGWEVCTGAPDVLAASRVRACEDLPPILETQGGIVAKLLATVVRYSGFRLIARETTSRGMVGLTEWTQDPDTGLWRQHDQPWTVCQAGQHRPAGPVLEVAA
ncbi:hypothetical protein [Kitasatospora purpeofusca]|uniref:hypothetical protein n=1 Tax=Kitasatospora purpeofusca TaxID=67352 RepID=UPI0038634CA1